MLISCMRPEYYHLLNHQLTFLLLLLPLLLQHLHYHHHCHHYLQLILSPQHSTIQNSFKLVTNPRSPNTHLRLNFLKIFFLNQNQTHHLNPNHNFSTLCIIYNPYWIKKFRGFVIIKSLNLCSFVDLNYLKITHPML